MKTLIDIILSLFITTLPPSKTHFEGTVVDRETHLPIDSVKITYGKYYHGDDIYTYTDSIGKFEFDWSVTIPTEFMAYTSEGKVHVKAEKKGYKKHEYYYDGLKKKRSITILLKKEKSK